MSLKLIGPINSGAAVGANGSATANQDSAQIVMGFVAGIYVKYTGAKPATTDVYIASNGASPYPPTRSILTLTNVTTDAWFYPSVQSQDVTGANIASVFQDIAVFDIVNVRIDQGNTGDNV